MAEKSKVDLSVYPKDAIQVALIAASSVVGKDATARLIVERTAQILKELEKRGMNLKS